ncbi:PASTA domain-containing protein [bacterium]|nr:PASTA domain-containing protein [bacterium]
MQLQHSDKPERRLGRERVVAVLFICVALVFIVRLVQLQVIQHGMWKNLALRQIYDRASEAMPRGEIRDRSGLPLAVTLPLSYAVGFRPREEINRDSLTAVLRNYLPLAESTIRTKLGSKNYTYIARRVDLQVQRELEELGLPGVEFTKEARRSYPATTAAGSVLGFVNVDGIGLSGIEQSLDSLLRGDRREMLVWNDALRTVPAMISPLNDELGHSGANVYLTIDLQLQTILDRCLVKGLEGKTFEKACALLMDPNTGEVLGLSTLPAFDPNVPANYTNDVRRCWPITDLFEPGSIFKVFTVGAGLEEGVVTPSTLIDCESGAYKVPGKVLRDAHAYSVLTLSEVIAKSSNIGSAKVAERLRAETFYSWILRFGFGSKTDIGLLAEPAGVVPKPANWSGPTRSNLAIGQGLSVTALQITAAYSAIANGGLLLQPKLIKALEFPSGEKVEFDPVALRQVLSERCVDELTQMMRSVVESGTGKQAAVKGVAIAGKTGTAQKVDLEAKSYYTNRYVSSFAGFFPADRPMYTLLVMVDDPRGQGYYGGQIAAPVFGAIAQEILEERHSYRPPKVSAVGKADTDSSDSEPKADSTQHEKFVYDTLRYLDVPLVTVPDVIGLPLRVAAVRMQNAGFETELVGFGIVASQSPPAGEKVPASFVCKVIAEPISAAHYAVSR